MRSSRLSAAGGVLLAGLIAAACGSAEGPGWTYQPAASVTPAPSGGASGEPSGSSPASGSPAASGSAAASGGGEPSASGGGGGEQLAVAAQNIAFDVKELSAAADTPFQIVFDNRENVPHDVDIRSTDGSVIDDNDLQPSAGQITYDVPALPAGEYQFICSVHPIPDMTGTLTVE